ncbi:hypothetical protein AB0H57_23555 [Micromonospora sp. NPDC050686]|uniref:hypothetical protein n=1 Tax=Micromonospora sp. NPDC050686 TaxID=3154631 RepID=UPI00340AABF9
MGNLPTAAPQRPPDDEGRDAARGGAARPGEGAPGAVLAATAAGDIGYGRRREKVRPQARA